MESVRCRVHHSQALRGKGRDGRAIGSAWYLDHDDDDVADADDVSDAIRKRRWPRTKSTKGAEMLDVPFTRRRLHEWDASVAVE